MDKNRNYNKGVHLYYRLYYRGNAETKSWVTTINVKCDVHKSEDYSYEGNTNPVI